MHLLGEEMEQNIMEIHQSKICLRDTWVKGRSVGRAYQNGTQWHLLTLEVSQASSSHLNALPRRCDYHSSSTYHLVVVR